MHKISKFVAKNEAWFWPVLVLVAIVLFKYWNRVPNFLMGKQLHPKFQPVVAEFIKAVEDRTGYKVIITSAGRSIQEQAKLYEENSSNAKPGSSYHEFGMAVDINAQKGTTVLKKSTPVADWVGSGIPAIAKEFGLRWGGDFTSYHDPVHFDWGVRYSIAYLQGKAREQYGPVAANWIGNELQLT